MDTHILKSAVFWTAIGTLVAIVALVLTLTMKGGNDGNENFRGDYIEVLLFNEKTGVALTNKDVEVITNEGVPLKVSKKGCVIIERRAGLYIRVLEKRSGRELDFMRITKDTATPVMLFLEL